MDTSNKSEEAVGEAPELDTADESLSDLLTNDAFQDWYHDRQFAANILEGKPYFNGPSPAKDPERYSPSGLLTCHRKASYKRQNAPREGAPPEGLFWIGSEFEERVIVPFLQDVVTSDETYVQNSVWVDADIPGDGHTLRIRGSTDPVLVTADAKPQVVTEIKTTSSLEHLSGPKPTHKAQLHAYLYALNEEYDHTIDRGIVVYGCRETFDIRAFTVEFDEAFWATIVDWMATHADYERNDELPPASPERDWECSYCSFKHRCGEADTPYSDIGHDGLLPLYDEYDRQNLTEYLDGHADQGAKLTPTLAAEFTDLVEEYGVYNWSCVACGETYAWDAVDWNGDIDDPPVCPNCVDDGHLSTLSGPEPDEQLSL